ncbi:MAG: hypothetical protein KKG02_05350 [Candidatus Edwardsbacteria bacterium]|nr:hypothetical protein [Candidatus Edwardsbacteria bacterium]
MKVVFPKPYRTSIEKILRFKKDFLEYRVLAKKNRLSNEEVLELKKLREKLNISLTEIARLVLQSGVGIRFHSDSNSIDIFTNIFNLDRLNIPSSGVIDLLDRSIGCYYVLRRNVYRRLINPFYWIGEVIRFPFRILSFAGFDSVRAEVSLIGKLYKFTMGLMTFILTAIQLLRLLGIDIGNHILK